MKTLTILIFFCLSAINVSARTASCFCTALYAPVCGTDGKTYSNEGCARCEGANIACKKACPCDDCICTTQYDPVCGIDGKTYGNACVAGCDHVDIKCHGECPCDDVCICPKIYRPVCGVDGNQYDNTCLAGCAGVPVDPNSHPPCKCHGGVVTCFAPPCDVTKCPAHPDAECIDNYCDCSAVFVKHGKVVDCNPPSSCSRRDEECNPFADDFPDVYPDAKKCCEGLKCCPPCFSKHQDGTLSVSGVDGNCQSSCPKC